MPYPTTTLSSHELEFLEILPRRESLRKQRRAFIVETSKPPNVATRKTIAAEGRGKAASNDNNRSLLHMQESQAHLQDKSSIHTTTTFIIMCTYSRCCSSGHFCRASKRTRLLATVSLSESNLDTRWVREGCPPHPRTHTQTHIVNTIRHRHGLYGTGHYDISINFTHKQIRPGVLGRMSRLLQGGK